MGFRLTITAASGFARSVAGADVSWEGQTDAIDPDPTCFTCQANGRASTKIFARPSPVGACTYVENVVGQVRPMVRERLPAAVLTIWSLRDGVCWPRRQPKETTRESTCWLCRGGNCRFSCLRAPAKDDSVLSARRIAAVEIGAARNRAELRCALRNRWHLRSQSPASLRASIMSSL
jgi:hypothetical protein